MIFVSSWDDGHPLDQRVADLLYRHRLTGTFYVPIRNQEGHAVMSPNQIRTLDSAFEIGSHTLDHIYLTELSRNDCITQVRHGKAHLEDILGHRINGFCYPGGKVTKDIRQIVQHAGFEYARTTRNYWLNWTADPFLIPTTLQFFPHKRMVFLRNYIGGGHYTQRAKTASILFSTNDWAQAIEKILHHSLTNNKVFHLWGHSWEIEKYQLWEQLDRFLKHVASFNPDAMNVADLARRIPERKTRI